MYPQYESMNHSAIFLMCFASLMKSIFLAFGIVVITFTCDFSGDLHQSGHSDIFSLVQVHKIVKPLLFTGKTSSFMVSDIPTFHPTNFDKV